MLPLYEFKTSTSVPADLCCHFGSSCRIDDAHLQRFLCRAAWLLLQLASLQRLDVLVALPVAVIQQVLFSLEQPLSGRHVTDADGEASVGCNDRDNGKSGGELVFSLHRLILQQNL